MCGGGKGGRGVTGGSEGGGQEWGQGPQGMGSIPSQNPIKNVICKVQDLESKQRFSEDSEWSTLEALKMP